MKWIRTHEARLHDLRFANLSAEAERTYNRLYLLAGILEADGLFLENGRTLSNEEIAYRARLDHKELIKALKELQKSNLIHVNGKGPQITDYKREQIDLNIKREKDRERQVRHRSVTRDNTVTDGESHSVTYLERETQTQTKTLLSLLTEPQKKTLEAHPDWIAEAIQIARNSGKDSDKYIAGILKNWIREGREKKGPTNGNAARRTQSAKPTTAKSQTDNDATRAAAERIIARRNKRV